MIMGSWNDIKIICGNHKEDETIEMHPQTGREGMSVFYACPCYQNMANGRSCNNRLNIVDYEKMLDTLMDEYISDDGQENNLTGLEWAKKGIYYKVLSHNGNNFVIRMLNKKGIGK